MQQMGRCFNSSTARVCTFVAHSALILYAIFGHSCQVSLFIRDVSIQLSMSLPTDTTLFVPSTMFTDILLILAFERMQYSRYAFAGSSHSYPDARNRRQ